MFVKSLGVLGAMSVTLALSACVTSQDSFTALGAKGLAIDDKYHAADPTAELPATGTATYKGAAEYNDVTNREDRVLRSNVTLTADFENSSIGGSFTNFRYPSDESVDGEVLMSNGQITHSDFTADLSGSLALAEMSGTVGGQMTGTFYGADANAIYGNIEGTFTNVLLPVDSFDFEGFLVAEKQ